MVIIWSCLQCKFIDRERWPKFCNKHGKIIQSTSKIPNFCNIREYDSLDNSIAIGSSMLKSQKQVAPTSKIKVTIKQNYACG